MRKNDNIAEFNGEALSEQEMNAYLSMTDEDTPDLWAKIEEGFAKETEKVKNNENDKVTNITSKKIKTKYIGILAACVLAVIIAIPVLGGAMGGRTKSDQYVGNDLDNAVYENTECEPMETPSGESAGDQNSYMFDAVTGNQNNSKADITSDEVANDGNDLFQDAEESVAENTENSIGKYIMIDSFVYEYEGVYVNKLPDGYAIIGTVQAVDSEYPDENFEGMGLEVGQNIYGSSSEESIIYIEVHENGYEKFIKK